MKRYRNSINWLSHAEELIPLGSQTFSKSKTQYPVGISPLYAEKAKGSYIWDIDGNRYIDLVSSLAAITLGYRNREVDASVKKQLRKGTIFSLPGKLEAEVAQKICNLVPSAEMVRFSKNGSDATSSAIRLARSYTGKNHVAVCGYHGWQDWYIGSTSRNKGVPKSVSAMTHSFAFNDIQSFKALIDTNPEIGCVILEPMNIEYPKDGFLEEIREITRRLGIVLVFDETVTGFRFSEGGAQELFKVIPDLSTFGKGLANGYPLSAIAGNREIMKEFENIFISGTFGGELLSLAAANSVLSKHEKREIVPELKEIGTDLFQQLKSGIEANGFSEILNLSGHPTWTFLNWVPVSGYSVNEIRTFFMQEMFANGVLVLNSNNVTLAMGKKEIRKIVHVYEKTLTSLRLSLNDGNLLEKTRAKPLVSLFSIR